jgi:DNA-directed RNA polymerase I, II, and III subunit RPABC2
MSYFGDNDDVDIPDIDNKIVLGSDDDTDTDTDSDIDSKLEDENENEDEVEVEEAEINEDDDDDVDDDDDDDDVMQGGANSENQLEEGEIDEEAESKAKRVKKIPAKTIYKKLDIDDEEDNDDDDDEDGEMYLQKFDQSVNDNYIVDFHPESVLQNYDEILSMSKVIRDTDGIIIDDLHKTIPYLTKYEKARILGQRSKQINAGAPSFVKVPENVIDGYIIAEMELKEKRIPFIIRRPLPNGGSEYWSLRDLEDISF